MTAELAKVQDAPVAPTSETAAILSLIERAARDTSVDVAKMERLFEMHQTAEKRRAEMAFNAAMAAAQVDLEPVTREKRNTHTGTRYADLAAIADVAIPVVAKHGFGLSFGTLPCDVADHIRMVCDVTHAAGHSKRYTSDLPCDFAGSAGKVNKTKIQAFGSTTTYGRRYMTMLIFNIATTDDDGNAPKPPRKSSAESKRDGTTELFNEIRGEITGSINIEMLRHVYKNRKPEIDEMPEKWADLLMGEFETKRSEFEAVS